MQGHCVVGALCSRENLNTDDVGWVHGPDLHGKNNRISYLTGVFLVKYAESVFFLPCCVILCGHGTCNNVGRGYSARASRVVSTWPEGLKKKRDTATGSISPRVLGTECPPALGTGRRPG